MKQSFFVELVTLSILLEFDNASHTGLGEMVAFLRVFAKKVTAYPSPSDLPC
jgi:hypothetical protein